jgi:hypothetical protein
VQLRLGVQATHSRGREGHQVPPKILPRNHNDEKEGEKALPVAADAATAEGDALTSLGVGAHEEQQNPGKEDQSEEAMGIQIGPRHQRVQISVGASGDWLVSRD